VGIAVCVPRGQSDRGADADVAAAAADVASHGGIDVSVAGVGILGQQSRGGHDLAGLAVAALHDLKFAPGVLDALAGRGIANCFDGDNFPPASSATGVTQERVGPAQQHLRAARVLVDLSPLRASPGYLDLGSGGPSA
jgi:hypothetical protein